MLVVAGILGFVLNSAGFRADQFYLRVLSGIPAGSAREETRQALETALRGRGIFLFVGVAGLVFSGSGLFGAMEHSFDLVWKTGARPFVRQKLMAVGMILLFTVLVAVSVLSSALLAGLEHVPAVSGVARDRVFAVAIQAVTGTVAGVLLFGAMFYLVPNRRQRVTHVIPGAVLSGVLFEALTLAFPIYLALARTNTYGKTFGLLFVILTFFYFVGILTMLGAELNSVLFEPAASAGAAPSAEDAPAAPREPRNATGLAILAVAVAALITGRGAARSARRGGSRG